MRAEEARAAVEEKIASDKLKEEEGKERYRRECEKWAGKNFPKALKSALRKIKRSAEEGYAATHVLRVINSEPKEILLSEMLIKELKQRGFAIYYSDWETHNHKCQSDYCGGTKVRGYYAHWLSGGKLPIGWVPGG